MTAWSTTTAALAPAGAAASVVTKGKPSQCAPELQPSTTVVFGYVADRLLDSEQRGFEVCVQ